MNKRIFVGVGAVALSMIFSATLLFTQTEVPGAGSAWHYPATTPQSPEWFVYSPDPTAAGGQGRGGAAPGGGPGASVRERAPGEVGGGFDYMGIVPACSKSPICSSRNGGGRGSFDRIEWKTTLGFTFAYPFVDLPPSVPNGGVTAVDVDSKDNLWAIQRNPVGKPQVFKFGPDHKLLFTVGDDVITHQYKAHGLKVDAQDNVWICDEAGTVKKLSPDGKLLLTLGVRGQRGDWDEAAGQRLLWEPVMVGFAPNGDIYIFEGHANESPNDIDFSPTNKVGVARVIHLDRNATFINQWYGNATGPGKFYQTHGSAVDPRNGDVYIGDREEYRIAVYSAMGKFIRTIQSRNLVCALYFDRTGQLWQASGTDGQYLKIDRDGNVLGAIGGPGRANGQFAEASYLTMDSKGNIYSGDTSVGRITEMVAPKK